MQANEAMNENDAKAKATAERTTKADAERRAMQKDAGGNNRTETTESKIENLLRETVLAATYLSSFLRSFLEEA